MKNAPLNKIFNWVYLAQLAVNILLMLYFAPIFNSLISISLSIITIFTFIIFCPAALAWLVVAIIRLTIEVESKTPEQKRKNIIARGSILQHFSVISVLLYAPFLLLATATAAIKIEFYELVLYTTDYLLTIFLLIFLFKKICQIADLHIKKLLSKLLVLSAFMYEIFIIFLFSILYMLFGGEDLPLISELKITTYLLIIFAAIRLMAIFTVIYIIGKSPKIKNKLLKILFATIFSLSVTAFEVITINSLITHYTDIDNREFEKEYRWNKF